MSFAHPSRVALAALTLVTSVNAQTEAPADASTTAAPAPSSDVATPSSAPITAPDLALGSPTVPASENPNVLAPALATPERDVAGGSPTPTPSAATDSYPDGSTQMSTVDLSSLPKRLPYRNEPSMPGYSLDERPRWWMIIGGGALLAGGYIASLVVASEHNFDNGLGFAAIPVAGPWIAAGQADLCSDSGCQSDVREQLLATGVFQTVGAVLLPIGLLSTRKVWLREDLALTVTPSPVGLLGQGLLVNGSF